MALPLEEVAEVLEPVQTLYAIPRTPDCFRGAMSFHGNVIPVLDAAAFFRRPAPSECKFLVLHKRGTNLALAVDSQVTVISEESAVEEEEGAGLYARILVLPEGKIPVLALDILLERIECSF